MPHLSWASAWRSAWSRFRRWDALPVVPWRETLIAPTLFALVLVATAPIDFLLFHSLAELFSIGVAITVFAVAWNTYPFTRRSFLLYLGCGYLWVAGLDLVHTLTYQGMGVFPIQGANVATQFWIAGRLYEAVLFLTAPLTLDRHVNPRIPLAAGGLMFAAVCALIATGHFPAAYVEGQGLTPFKIGAEYIVVLLLLASITLLWRRRAHMDPAVNRLVTIAIGLTIFAELAFTRYLQIVSIPMVIGHVLKFWSYWFVYIALVQFTLRNPFQILGPNTGAYDAFPECTALVDRRGIIRQVNRALRDAWGDRPLIGQPCHAVLHPRDLAQADCPVCQAIRQGTPAQGLELSHSDQGRWEEITLTPFFWSSRVEGMVHVARDVTERRRGEERLSQLAHHDPLTGRPNRLLFHARVTHALDRARRENTRIAVLFIDLDRFKQVNDTLGHGIGDRLLVETAARLESCVRQEDTVARLGGDEFTVLLEPLHQPADAARVAEKIVHALGQPFHLDGHPVTTGGSVGVSIYPEHGRDLGTLLHSADEAMYRAKQLGRGNYQFYSEEMTAGARERQTLKNGLQQAIDHSELRLYYQPQVEVESGRVVGVEALSRWRHPEKGILFPERFIPLAEETGLIASLDEWVLRTACLQGRRWRDQGFPLHVAVNVSGKDLARDDWIARLEAILKESGLDPASLELEVSEAWLMSGAERAVERLHELKRLGVRITIDHFGTGLSSLTYLKRLPLDKLKIDQSVLESALQDADDAAIIRAIIALGHTLDLKITAMGVSTDAQLAFLRGPDHNGAALGGGDEYQGFLYQPPLPAEELDRRLRESAVVRH
ncbi:MAG: hypothetical protein H6R10_3522 [Rhodocyclaceae bacterium]|nr:hypothetical protein [Rhodocyclaceae bacterium]